MDTTSNLSEVRLGLLRKNSKDFTELNTKFFDQPVIGNFAIPVARIQRVEAPRTRLSGKPLGRLENWMRVSGEERGSDFHPLS
jgi:hypothetical protein